MAWELSSFEEKISSRAQAELGLLNRFLNATLQATCHDKYEEDWNDRC